MNSAIKMPIYLDYAATTPVRDEVLYAMQSCLTLKGNFANPNSLSHSMGILASDAVEKARFDVADLLGCQPDEIIFTSGATEANNLAIRGVAYASKTKGSHIITIATEHKAVLETCRQLEREGFSVTYLTPLSSGLINLEMIEKAIRSDTILVSVMHVNNELGVIHDIHTIGNFLKEKNIVFHVDAAQSAGKLAIDLSKMPVDLMSVSAHKVYGPKGIGTLYINKSSKISIEPIIYGGGQEQNLRAGTLPTHQIAGMGKAFSLAKEDLERDYQFIRTLNERFLKGLMSIENAHINGDRMFCIPHIVNFRIEGVDANELLNALPELALSVGSACNSNNANGSHVLKAIGLSPLQARSSLRISFGRFNKEEEVDFAIEHLKKAVQISLKNKQAMESI
jgi:cysteine desulfurase